MSKSVEELIEDLNDQDEFVVEAAAGELEMMGEESVLSHFIHWKTVL